MNTFPRLSDRTLRNSSNREVELGRGQAESIGHQYYCCFSLGEANYLDGWEPIFPGRFQDSSWLTFETVTVSSNLSPYFE